MLSVQLLCLLTHSLTDLSFSSRYMIAGLSSHDGNNYVDTSVIRSADWVTFLWTTTFPIGFYAPAVIPCLIAFGVTTVETVGDISATYEVSELDNTGPEFLESLQGGLFSDSICTILSGLGTSMPNTTFSQNNGVIALVSTTISLFIHACSKALTAQSCIAICRQNVPRSVPVMVVALGSYFWESLPSLLESLRPSLMPLSVE